MSLIMMRNSIGPSTDPCGTPDKTFLGLESTFSTLTLCSLFRRNSQIQLITFPVMFMLTSFLRRIAWSTLSKAFAKSR